MYRLFVTATAVLATALGGLETGARADTVAFTGTRSNVDAPGAAAARCGARTTITIVNGPGSTSVGNSNFGAFNPTLSHCIQLPPPGPYDLGEFLFEFASGTLFGTYDGVLTFNAPGVFNILQNHIVTGGTGQFAGATGTFTSMGTLSFPGGRPTAQQTFAGLINAPGIPEPASWAMMIAGFGLAGAALRKRPPVASLA